MGKFILLMAILIIWPFIELLKCRVKKDDYATHEEYLAAKFEVYPRVKKALIRLGLIVVLVVLGLLLRPAFMYNDGLADLVIIAMAAIIFYLAFSLRKGR